MAREGRGVIVQIWKNFVASITTKRLPGKEVGRDHFGNKYFEIPADPSRGKRKPRRWFEPRIEENFTAEMPAEWEAWLRGRRTVPPTQEEIAYNQALMESKKQKAALLEGKAAREREQRQHGETPIQQSHSSFPSYDDYKQTDSTDGSTGPRDGSQQSSGKHRTE